MSLEIARTELGYCCQTLCRKDVVADALPKITMEEALYMLYEATYAEPDDVTGGVNFLLETEDAQHIIKTIYGK